MNILGIHLTLLIGPSVPLPAPPVLTERIDSVEVTHSDESRSGFQITFQAGRSGPVDLLDYPLLSNPLLKPFNRVVLITTFNATPRVLMDGMITNQQLMPSNEPGASKIVVTGEDLSIMMDMEEKSVEHPAQGETVIANKIILSYAQYGIIPAVIPPPVIDIPIPIERTPVQQGTDLQYLKEMAERYGYVFYITPGPAPLVNTAYWGPPLHAGIPQKALSMNMGPDTNVESVSFQNNALGTTFTFGRIRDRLTGQDLPVATAFSTRIPLSSQPAWITNQPNVRRTQFRQSGLNIMQAMAQAQGATDGSMDNVVTANGELDAMKYGYLLTPRGLAGLRGVGYHYDGFYYVKSVTHNITRGSYKQRFTLTREGVGALSPAIPA